MLNVEEQNASVGILTKNLMLSIMGDKLVKTKKLNYAFIIKMEKLRNLIVMGKIPIPQLDNLCKHTNILLSEKAELILEGI